MTTPPAHLLVLPSITQPPHGQLLWLRVRGQVPVSFQWISCRCMTAVLPSVYKPASPSAMLLSPRCHHFLPLPNNINSHSYRNIQPQTPPPSSSPTRPCNFTLSLRFQGITALQSITANHHCSITTRKPTNSPPHHHHCQLSIYPPVTNTSPPPYTLPAKLTRKAAKKRCEAELSREDSEESSLLLSPLSC
jgi:hypothetical protein